MKTTTILSTAFALGARAVGTLNYTDSNTGISYSGYSNGECTVGIALPESHGPDFIGNIVGPLKDGAGWAGLDTGVSMAGKLLIVAWPNGNDVVISPRKASGYVTPSVYTGDITLKTVAKGTFVNETHYSATFLCKGCINVDSFSATVETITLAYAYSKTKVTDPTDSSSALSYHAAGFGGFGMTASFAESPSYSKWAAMATAVTNTTPSNGTSTNGTAPRASSTPVTTTTSNSTYDYIVAGAGPAGIIVAQRLVEAGSSVLLLERGGASAASTGGTAMTSWNSSVTQYDVPAMAYYLPQQPECADAYCTDTASQAGCILGGGTMINALMFVPPQDKDWEKWPAGWSSSDIKTASRRLFTRNPGTNSPSADGKRYDQDVYDSLSKFLGGNGWNSVDPLDDVNAKVDTYAYPPWNIQDHMRGGPVKTYLPLAQADSKFKLQINTKVIRAVRNGTWISGVEVENKDGSHQIINITPRTGKVILAAGALSTPRTLFYSGIGPIDQIKAVPSDVTLPDESEWINLPVGHGLKDHSIITIKLASSGLTCPASTAFTSPDQQNTDLFAQGSGLLTQSGQRLNWWTSVTSPSDGITRYLQGTCGSSANNTISMKVYVTHGLTSSTNLVLDTTGANTAFESSPWLKTQGDIEAYTGFFDRLISMTSKGNSSLTLLRTDGSAISGNMTGADYYADVKTTLTSGDHYVGTAKMGAIKNGSAVVDTNTKVFGIDNLFVVDASIHPDLPTGNTQAIVMIAAEKAAENILSLSGSSISDSGSSSTGSGSTMGSGSSTGSGRSGSSTGSGSTTGSSSSPAGGSSSGGSQASTQPSGYGSTSGGKTSKCKRSKRAFQPTQPTIRNLRAGVGMEQRRTRDLLREQSL